MISLMDVQRRTSDAEETEGIAESIGQRLHGGEVIELSSDLGGGKTTFTRGLARGMGSADTVASPTFTISKLYRAGELTMHHFDFYRLPDAGLMANELSEVVEDPKAVIVVEWGGIVADVLPPKRLKIDIKNLGGDNRALEFSGPDELSYLVEGL